MTESLVRLTNNQGADEANLENHSFKIRPDGSFIVPKHIGDILTSDGHSGFVEHADDESTVREIQLLTSVLQDQAMRTAIGAAIISRQLLALQ
jgi:hypothetical protein